MSENTVHMGRRRHSSRLLRWSLPTLRPVHVGIFALVVLCSLPLLLIEHGLHFELPVFRALFAEPYESSTALAMTRGINAPIDGLLTHIVLVLLASVVALFSASLALVNYHVKRTPLAAVIGLALFWSGSTDVVQVLFTDGWLMQLSDGADLINLTWTLSRLFTAGILISAASIVYYRLEKGYTTLPARTIVLTFLGFGAAALLIAVLATGFDPVRLIYPLAAVKRPWDLPALALFVVGAALLFPRLHRSYQSHFSLALWLSMIPLIAAQICLIFASLMRFDDAFVVAYGLNLIGFLVLSGGLVADYVHSARQEATLGEEVRSREARLRAVIENATDAIISIGLDRRIQLWNPLAMRMFGWSQDEALGTDLVDRIFRFADRPTLRTNWRTIIEHAEQDTDGPFRELTLIRRDGSSFCAEYSVAGSTVEDADTTTLFIRDITEQRQLKLRMIQMDRLITTGTLAAGVGHEINNPLTYVMAHAEIALSSLHTDPEQVEQSLAAIAQGAERINIIVKNLRVLSSFQESERRPVSLEAALQVAVNMTRHRVEPRARFVEDRRPTPPILADEARLTQVFINLLINAAQALPERPKEENRIDLRTYTKGDQVIAEVEDNGVGISAEIAERIFDQFFTTKPAGEGSGLGLALCRQIVESFGGTITVNSKLGVGTTFRVSLPAATDYALSSTTPLESTSTPSSLDVSKP
ncbi:MAG: PAS domain S-box protein [Bradymonadaceae bacterium]|nr:PAS domain S-box protein [Lujinxingiaceae bacterium]